MLPQMHQNPKEWPPALGRHPLRDRTSRLSATRVGRLSLLGCAAVLQLGAAKCGQRVGGSAATAPIALNATPVDSAEQVMFSARAVLTDRGVTHGTLLADTARVFAEGARHELRRVNLTFTDTLGASTGVLTAQGGTYDALHGQVALRGQVLIVAADGRRLQTESLTYDVTRNVIRTDQPYTLTEGKRTNPGTGFEWTPALKTLPKPAAPKSALSSRAKTPSGPAATRPAKPPTNDP